MSDAIKKYGRDTLRLIRERGLPLLPGGLGAPIQSYLQEFQEIFLESRPPRLVLVGSSGAGKSAVVNAILGRPALPSPEKGRRSAASWHTVGGETGALDVLEARLEGPGKGEGPLRPSLRRALLLPCPDVVLYVANAVDAARDLSGESGQLEAMMAHIEETHHALPPLFLVVTHADEVPPVGGAGDSYAHAEKIDNIDAAVGELERSLANSPRTDPVVSIAVSSRLNFEEGLIASDSRWQIDQLVDALVDRLPRSTHMELARAAGLKQLQRQIARRLGQTTASLAAGIAATPIPLADLPILTSLQTAMLMAIGYISGRSMKARSVAEFMSAMGVNVGVGFAARQMARQLGKLLPVAGSVVSSAVAYATTAGLAHAAVAYFIDERSAREARDIFRRERDRHRREGKPPADGADGSKH
ncbi:MAG: hypothetical protein IT368_18710 [Candidatus Hydrogenedentes bacterium]|nr:hypothetical protein [Candidatus Hydrogenedentota bacterium]